MKKTFSPFAVLVIFLVTLFGFTACNNHCSENKDCKKQAHFKMDKKCMKNHKGCMPHKKSCCKADDKKCTSMKDKNFNKATKGIDSVSTKSATIYVCPMHQEVTSNQPGTCSKCGMKLVKQ